MKFILLQPTDNTEKYSDDYLRLFNHTTTAEEREIHKILSDIMIGLERLQEIQDDCYGR